MTAPRNDYVRSLVGVAAAVFLATTCMLAAAGPAAVAHTGYSPMLAQVATQDSVRTA